MDVNAFLTSFAAPRLGVFARPPRSASQIASLSFDCNGGRVSAIFAPSHNGRKVARARQRVRENDSKIPLVPSSRPRLNGITTRAQQRGSRDLCGIRARRKSRSRAQSRGPVCGAHRRLRDQSPAAPRHIRNPEHGREIRVRIRDDVHSSVPKRCGARSEDDPLARKSGRAGNAPPN